MTFFRSQVNQATDRHSTTVITESKEQNATETTEQEWDTGKKHVLLN